MATNYREILRLAKLGYSQRSIAASAGCARSTVQRVLERAESNPRTLEAVSYTRRQRQMCIRDSFGRAAGPVGQGNTTSFVSRVIYPFHAEAAGLRARPPGTGKKRRDSKLALE